VITHGNGPQIGNLALQQEERKMHVPPQPLDALSAMTQGQIGYMIQQALMNLLEEAGIRRSAITVITRVLVDGNDPGFGNPSKPIGPYYSLEEAEEVAKRNGYNVKAVKPNGDKVYRRIVPSPEPISIVEGEAIKRLVECGFVVIASGGGGIPVIRNRKGSLRGVEAVVDKDLAGERLAEAVGADTFLIVTDVEKVKLNFGKPDEKDLDRLTVEAAKKYLAEGHFLPGSMEPKVLSCVRFIERGGKRAIITSLDKSLEAIKGRAGTLISRD
jgi:carbamate kinase